MSHLTSWDAGWCLHEQMCSLGASYTRIYSLWSEVSLPNHPAQLKFRAGTLGAMQMSFPWHDQPKPPLVPFVPGSTQLH